MLLDLDNQEENVWNLHQFSPPTFKSKRQQSCFVVCFIVSNDLILFTFSFCITSLDRLTTKLVVTNKHNRCNMSSIVITRQQSNNCETRCQCRPRLQHTNTTPLLQSRCYLVSPSSF